MTIAFFRLLSAAEVATLELGCAFHFPSLAFEASVWDGEGLEALGNHGQRLPSSFLKFHIAR